MLEYFRPRHFIAFVQECRRLRRLREKTSLWPLEMLEDAARCGAITKAEFHYLCAGEWPEWARRGVK